jgi:hypothetical protein
MFGRSRKEKLKENATNVSALALQLAQDRKFRRRLLSAIEHSAEAGRRTRRGLGLSGAVARLATDQTLLRELRSARDDLQQAYGRLEAKRRSHKLRNVVVLAALASVAGVPQLRERAATAVKRARQRLPRPGEPASNAGHSKRSDESPSRPRRLEDLSKEELYARAQELDIPGRSEMSKEQLVEALRGKG